jgi:hypothetical protein
MRDERETAVILFEKKERWKRGRSDTICKEREVDLILFGTEERCKRSGFDTV